MAYNTPESVADYLSRFQMQVTERTKGTFSPMHVKYSLALKMGSSSFETTFQSNPNVHGEPTVTQVFGALASDAMLARDYGMDEFADEFCADLKPSEAIRSYNSCKDTYNWMRDSLHLSNGDIASLSEVIGENESEVGALVEQAASERAARHAYDHPKLPKGFVTIEQLQGDLDLGDLRDEVEDFDFDGDLGKGRDIAGRANPYVLSVDTVRAVNEKGYDAVFAEQWKTELSECDIDPEAVSVDSEAHDMENGRDGLDGNAPEKDATEKDDRDAQPPVDTDNR